MLTIWWSVKYFFAPNSPISQKGWTKSIQAITKGYAFQANEESWMTVDVKFKKKYINFLI